MWKILFCSERHTAIHERSLPSSQSGTMTTAKSLYQRVLREKMSLLPEPMRAFHASVTGGRCEGTLRVRRGSNFIAHLAATLGGLPQESDATTVQLQVIPDANKERWVRKFGESTLSSIQWEENGLLIEQFPMMRFGLELVPEGTTLVHKLRRCWLGPLPLPLALAPRIATTATGIENGWRLSVRVSLPVIGRLIEYEGDIRCRV